MKFVVEIKETLTRNITVCGVNSYEEAERYIRDRYKKCEIILNADNSNVITEFSDNTDNFIKAIGIDAFNDMMY